MGAKALSKMARLKSLYLRNNNIGDEGAKFLSSSNTIEMLSTESNNITNVGAQEFARMINLKSLQIADNKIEDEGIKQLLKLPNLHSICIYDNPFDSYEIENFLTVNGYKFQDFISGVGSLDELGTNDYAKNNYNISNIKLPDSSYSMFWENSSYCNERDIKIEEKNDVVKLIA